MREFYKKYDFAENRSISTRMGYHSMKLDEDLLGKILGVPTGGIRSVVGKT